MGCEACLDACPRWLGGWLRKVFGIQPSAVDTYREALLPINTGGLVPAAALGRPAAAVRTAELEPAPAPAELEPAPLPPANSAAPSSSDAPAEEQAPAAVTAGAAAPAVLEPAKSAAPISSDAPAEEQAPPAAMAGAALVDELAPAAASWMSSVPSSPLSVPIRSSTPKLTPNSPMPSETFVTPNNSAQSTPFVSPTTTPLDSPRRISRII
ncbi:hypothetical protein T492DRAFT_963210 [Pavlovales sp. CCMP2436]|nr:hypothetical protein T492DRAFT_963210 [Pavlovales sp. CCMP2436]|mmetsp:Transcript_12414/g.31418  ORF Transcript_12414/g.31418 Transcript_12414/m.31418 type:complete len:211 (-) Transcript_12414:200-832(-)